MAKSTKPIEERDPKKRHAGRLGGYKGGRKGGLARAKLPKKILSAIGRMGGTAKGVNAAKRRAAETAARAPDLAALNAEIARRAKELAAVAVALEPLSPLQIEAIYRRARGYRDHDSKSTGAGKVARLVEQMNRDGRNGPKPTKPEKRKRGRPRKGE